MRTIYETEYGQQFADAASARLAERIYDRLTTLTTQLSHADQPQHDVAQCTADLMRLLQGHLMTDDGAVIAPVPLNAARDDDDPLRDIRAALGRGLSQAYLARQAGVSRSRLNQALRGKEMLGAAALTKLRAVL